MKQSIRMAKNSGMRRYRGRRPKYWWKIQHMNTAPASISETGVIPILGLKRLWSNALLPRGLGMTVACDPAEWRRDRICLSVVGIGLEEALVHLHRERPAFDAFERWILDANPDLDLAAIDRFNRALDEPATATCDEIAGPLTANDLHRFDEQGYVVLKQALDAGEAHECEQAVWTAVGAEPANQASWHAPHPLRQNIMVQCFRGPAFERNRRNLRIRAAFEQLYQRRDLWAMVDRIGFNPPTGPDITYAPARLHWDVDLTSPVPFELQGVIYFNDVATNQGAFSCVPAFHRRLDPWLRSLPPNADPQQQDLDALGRVFVAGSAGDMVIWHQALPHGASHNSADYPRLVQYLTYLPLR